MPNQSNNATSMNVLRQVLGGQEPNASEIQETLGGDLDDISHLFGPEYWDAVNANDDDLEDQIIRETIQKNPGAIASIVRQTLKDRSPMPPRLPRPGKFNDRNR